MGAPAEQIVRPFSTAVWSSAFRPFFLAGAIYGLLLMASIVAAAGQPDPLLHGHEMIFGFTGATACGFILTALPSWAGTTAIVGGRLAFLVAVWLAGRVVVTLSGTLPPGLVATIDVALFPLLGAMIAPGLLAGRERRYAAVLIVVAGLFAANLLFHLGWAAQDSGLARMGLRLGIAWQMVLFTLASGLLVPAFTMTVLADKGMPATIIFLPWIEGLAVLSTILCGATDVAVPGTALAAAAALAAFVVHAVRFARWRTVQILDVPVLWVLHLGYLWFVLSFALRVLADFFESVPQSIPLHAFTIGALSTVIVGIMARVALRHTGRALRPPPIMVAGFLAIGAAAIVRLVGAWLGESMPAIVAAAILWSLPFLIFLALHGTMLLRPSLPRAVAAGHER